MPSFDTVSELDMHEVTNAIDQAKRELGNRWDLKNVTTDIVLDKDTVTFSAEVEFQLDMLVDMLRMAFAKRGLDARSISRAGDSKAGKLVKRTYEIKQGIDQDIAKKMVKLVKDAKMKAQVSIQGDKVRVTAKKRDDLQEVMRLFKNAELDIPLQFDNFRD